MIFSHFYACYQQSFQHRINYVAYVFLLGIICVRRKYLVSPSHRKYRHHLKQKKMVQLMNYKHSINLMPRMQQIHGYGIPFVPHRFMCAELLRGNTQEWLSFVFDIFYLYQGKLEHTVKVLFLLLFLADPNSFFLLFTGIIAFFPELQHFLLFSTHTRWFFFYKKKIRDMLALYFILYILILGKMRIRYKFSL